VHTNDHTHNCRESPAEDGGEEEEEEGS